MFTAKFNRLALCAICTGLASSFNYPGSLITRANFTLTKQDHCLGVAPLDREFRVV